MRRLIIPADQGYGQRAAGQIPPGSTLYFEVEVVRVFPPRKPPESPLASDARFRPTKDVLYADVNRGEGNKPTQQERVCVDYAAWVGTELVAHTFERENCYWFRYEPGKVSDGLYQGLRTMRAGGMRQLRMSGALAADPTWSVTVPGEVEVLLEVLLVEAKERVK